MSYYWIFFIWNQKQFAAPSE